MPSKTNPCPIERRIALSCIEVLHYLMKRRCRDESQRSGFTCRSAGDFKGVAKLPRRFDVDQNKEREFLDALKGNRKGWYVFTYEVDYFNRVWFLERSGDSLAYAVNFGVFEGLFKFLACELSEGKMNYKSVKCMWQFARNSTPACVDSLFNVTICLIDMQAIIIPVRSRLVNSMDFKHAKAMERTFHIKNWFFAFEPSVGSRRLMDSLEGMIFKALHIKLECVQNIPESIVKEILYNKSVFRAVSTLDFVSLSCSNKLSNQCGYIVKDEVHRLLNKLAHNMKEERKTTETLKMDVPLERHFPLPLASTSYPAKKFPRIPMKLIKKIIKSFDLSRMSRNGKSSDYFDENGELSDDSDSSVDSAYSSCSPSSLPDLEPFDVQSFKDSYEDTVPTLSSQVRFSSLLEHFNCRVFFPHPDPAITVNEVTGSYGTDIFKTMPKNEVPATTVNEYCPYSTDIFKAMPKNEVWSMDLSDYEYGLGLKSDGKSKLFGTWTDCTPESTLTTGFCGQESGSYASDERFLPEWGLV